MINFDVFLSDCILISTIFFNKFLYKGAKLPDDKSAAPAGDLHHGDCRQPVVILWQRVFIGETCVVMTRAVQYIF